MKTLLVDNETTLLDELRELIPGNETVRSWREVASGEVAQYDLLILSGGGAFPVVGDQEKRDTELQLLRDFNGPIIGICFGAELIAQSYGGALQRMERQHRGLVTISVCAEHAIFGGVKQFQAYENHHWAITQLPEAFTILARSDHGIAAFRHAHKPIYGLQFHPERVPDSHFSRALFRNIFEEVRKAQPNL